MWTHVGLIREEDGLGQAEAVLAGWAATGAPTGSVFATSAEGPDVLTGHEDAHLLLLARLLTRSARRRTTSLGAHFRGDAAPVAATMPSPELVLETH